jgi:hypothetical protein
MITYDVVTGEPQVQIAYQTPYEKEVTLRSLLEFLENQGKPAILAIDEFQQIMEFPEKNIEALLRTYIQPLNNINFIFCGSKKTMMLDIFSNSKRPFFGMTQYLNLEKIDREKYAEFIKNKFEENKKRIDNEAINFILNWTETYTYYTQMVCNTVFTLSDKKINLQTAKNACAYILQHNEHIFLQYRQLLTSAQWNFLIAVAKENTVTQITAANFVQKYQIGSAANAKRLTKALIDKDLLLAEANFNNITYQVYDLFLKRWLQSKY